MRAKRIFETALSHVRTSRVELGFECGFKWFAALSFQKQTKNFLVLLSATFDRIFFHHDGNAGAAALNVTSPSMARARRTLFVSTAGSVIALGIKVNPADSAREGRGWMSGL